MTPSAVTIERPARLRAFLASKDLPTATVRAPATATRSGATSLAGASGHRPWPQDLVAVDPIQGYWRTT